MTTDDVLSAAWFQEALAGLLPAGASVTGADAVPVGTGQVADTLRVTLTYDPAGAGPATVVAKVASSDERSRAAAVMLHLYETEVSFYRDLPALAGVPRCFYAAYDPDDGTFTLVLEDASPAETGNDLVGCDPEVAEAALCRLAEIQAACWNAPELAALAWLNRNTPEVEATVASLVGSVAPMFLERFGSRLAAEHVGLIERFVPRLGAWSAADDGPRTLSHRDFRLDNMLLRPGDPAPVVVDWQTVVWGHPAYDVAYFLGGSLTTEVRREHQDRLLDAYHRTLVAHGVTDYSREQIEADVRYRSAGGVVMAVAASMLVVPTERGDEMFAISTGRHAQHVLDRDAEAVFPAPPDGPAHVVAEADEARHDPAGEELWNESWYADVVSADGSVGAYVRLGLYPNLDGGRAWLNLIVTGPDRPLVSYAGYDLPVPAGALTLSADGVELTIEIDPLRSMRVRATVPAASHDDPAAIYRHEPGRPTAVELDATWRTDGVPYHYDLTTRYEIPCQVTGTVTVGGEELPLDGAGQRDHSFGVRDWWTFGWCWAAARMADGERLHVADIRLPTGNMAFGYRQRDGAVEPVTALRVTETTDSEGFVGRGEIEAQGETYEISPLAWGPALLVAPDGREARFPRAMARYRSGDREGYGWVEWNQPG